MMDITSHRSGETFNEQRDGARLNRQAKAVYAVMSDGQWRTLAQIAALIQEPEASISARLRDLRKRRFGSHVVEREYIADGVWQYRVSVQPQETETCAS